MRWWQDLSRDQRLLFANNFITGFGVALFLNLQPIYISQLGATPAQVGLTLSLSGLIVTVLYVPLGLWADRHGRKPMIVSGWVLSGLAALAMAAAPDWRWFIPALTVYLMSNFAVPALQGYVAASGGGRNLGRLFALLAAGNSVGSVAAPALGGWLGEHVGLRTVYAIAGVLFVLDGLLVLGRLAPQAAPPAAQRAPAFGLLRSGPFRVEVLFTLMLFVAVDVGQVLAPKYLQDVRHLSVSQIGWLGSLGTLGVAGLTLALGRLPSERRTPLLIAQALAAASLSLWLSSPWLGLIALGYFIGGGNRVIRPLLASRLAARLKPEDMSFGFGFYQTAQQLGLTISPFLAGQLYARDPSWPLLAGLVGIGLTVLVTAFRPARPAAVLAAP